MAETKRRRPVITMKKDNELIAEFDGWVKHPEMNKGSRIQWIHPKYSTKLSSTLSIPTTPENMKYPTSWDWLMPVVHKILKTTSPKEGQGWSWEYKELEKTRVGNSIEYVYERVIQFIKWYNTHLPEQEKI